jgi:transcriptional regulator with XRE-family HTH domain
MKSQQEIFDKLNRVVASEPSKWLADADYRLENKAWLVKSQAIALKILRSLRAKGLSQRDLADKLNVTPQQVNKWVKGGENFTIETIAKIEQVLDIVLIEIPTESSKIYQDKQVFVVEQGILYPQETCFATKIPTLIKMDYPNIRETFQLKIA